LAACLTLQSKYSTKTEFDLAVFPIPADFKTHALKWLKTHALKCFKPHALKKVKPVRSTWRARRPTPANILKECFPDPAGKY
jgi:hypothetical protein